MKFSIILPTRERPELLKRLLDSICVTSQDCSELEVLLAVDSDDSITWEFLNSNNYHFVKPFEVQRSLNFSQDYYSFLGKQAKGRWVIVCNDDAVFETPQWDVLAYEVLKDKPSIVYGWSEDGIGEFRAKGHGVYCCFPLFGRGGIEALGCVFPSRIPTWGADIWARMIYDHVQSIVTLPITIRHYCFHNNTRPADKINSRIQNSQVLYDIRPKYEEVNVLLGVLKEELNGQAVKQS